MLRYIQLAIEQYIKSGNSGDPDGKFTLYQFIVIIDIAVKLQEEDIQEELDKDHGY